MFGMTKEDVIEFIKSFEPNYEFERIDINKTSLSRKCMICHYWYFKDLGFYFKPNVCNKCHGKCIFLLSNINGDGLSVFYGVLVKKKLLVF